MIPYIIKISGGIDIQIDEDELPKVLSAKQNKDEVVVLKKGILFNPNYIIGVFKDTDRMKKILENNRLNAHAIREGLKEPAEVKALPDDFVQLRKKLLK